MHISAFRPKPALRDKFLISTPSQPFWLGLNLSERTLAGLLFFEMSFYRSHSSEFSNNLSLSWNTIEGPSDPFFMWNHQHTYTYTYRYTYMCKYVHFWALKLELLVYLNRFIWPFCENEGAAWCLPLVFLPFLIWKTSSEWSDVVCDVNGIMKAYRLQEKWVYWCLWLGR